MRRIVSLSALLLLMLGLVIFFVLVEARRAPDWLPPLNDYLVVRNRAATEMIMTRLVGRAANPWLLKREMVAETIAEDPERLLFPPREAWCVVLERDLRGEATVGVERFELVLVTYHVDTHYSTWAIHEVRGNLAEPATTNLITRLGCSLNLTELEHQTGP